MWRRLLCNIFESTLVIQTTRKRRAANNFWERSSWQISNVAQTYFQAIDEKPAQIRTKGKHEGRTTAQTIEEALEKYYRLPKESIRRILRNEAVKKIYAERPVEQNIISLCNAGVSAETILTHPCLICSQDPIEEKIAVIKTLKLRDINHFAPFMQLTLSRLRSLVKSLKREARAVPFGNRIYFLANELNLEPVIITNHLCSRLFVMEMSFPMLRENLNLMLRYEVSPLSILKDLWALKYMPNSINMRLERMKRAKKGKLMPWMVRCPEARLQKSIKNTQNNLTVLGDKGSTLEYLAERINFNLAETKAIMDRHPLVHKVQPVFMKEKLDYLLNEAGFTNSDIADCPRILCHSLKTTKERLEELKLMGCRPKSLGVVCRSKRNYEKFKAQWLKMLEDGYQPPSIVQCNNYASKI